MMFFGRKSVKRAFAILIAVMLIIAMGTVAFATSINDFYWYQATGAKYVNLGQLSVSSSPNSGISYYFVATSPSDGQFRVVLQRNEPFLGIFDNWVNVDGDAGYRTASQTSSQKYDPRNGGYVYGQPNLFTWLTNTSGQYRIVMDNPTNPQVTVFTRVEFWTF